jgi:hypothetical protein
VRPGKHAAIFFHPLPSNFATAARSCSSCVFHQKPVETAEVCENSRKALGHPPPRASIYHDCCHEVSYSRWAVGHQKARAPKRAKSFQWAAEASLDRQDCQHWPPVVASSQPLATECAQGEEKAGSLVHAEATLANVPRAEAGLAASCHFLGPYLRSRPCLHTETRVNQFKLCGTPIQRARKHNAAAKSPPNRQHN